jgi:imidazolonepropionase
MATLFVRAREIITCETTEPQCGIAFEKLGSVRDAAMLVSNGIVTALGPERDVAPMAAADAVELDVRDCVVVPGFVDAHSHPLFAGDREPDFAARTRGDAPLQGMLCTVQRTREALADPDEFYARSVRPRLYAMLAHGTTTLETKTGYALTKDGEFALLDLVAAHRDDDDVPRLISTFLGAHAVPPEFTSAGAYVDYLIDECLPAAGAHGAQYADVFCELGFFAVDDARRYLRAAVARGLRGRIHCDEMAGGGAGSMAAAAVTDLRIDAVDHCNFIDDATVDAIAKSGVVLVACPATVEFLDIGRHAPVRAVLERGGRVAFASDFNPGTSPCFNLQTVAYYARKIFGVGAAEALYGVTRAAAASTQAAVFCGTEGSLRPGGAADFVALRIDDPREFGWQFGGNLAKVVVRGGVLVGPSTAALRAYARDDK